jgi:ABC-type antimicrobial peptide transport system permease subunit
MARKANGKKLLRGNRLWPLGYALSSLRSNRTRNIGIALVIAISIALPTTVSAWSDTGMRLAVRDYFNSSVYQFSIQSKSTSFSYSNLFKARDLVLTSPFVEYAQITPSTVGILNISGVTPEWDRYYTNDVNYAYGIKDTRVVVMTPEILQVWSSSLQWEGNLTLGPGEILVSQRFLDTAREVTNNTVELGLGSKIGIDVLRNNYAPPPYYPFNPLKLNIQTLQNLTIVGIYDISGLSLIGQSFPEVYRPNYDPLGPVVGVMGIRDSVLLSADQLGEDSVEMIENYGFFPPVGFVRGSADDLIHAGPIYAAANMLRVKTMVEESDDKISVIGLYNIEQLQARIDTYAASQVLTLLALPVMIVSFMLTLFTSEISVSQKKGEISALRAKGASFGQIFGGFLWESLILALAALFLGLGLAALAAPLMGSSTGLLSFDPSLYQTFLHELNIPIQAVGLAIFIALFLPMTYLYQVQRRIDVSEIGQPTTRLTYEIPEEVSVSYYAIGLTIVLVAMLMVPILIRPIGLVGFFEILVSTLLLFVASYLGSRAMRLITANLSQRASFIMGEKRLYLTQSLRRRKGQFIPLLVILSLTLTITTSMLIQTASFQSTMVNEANYSIGSTVRVKTTQHLFNWTYSLPGYSAATGSTPILQATAERNDDLFYLEGIRANDYKVIGDFKSTSFVGASATDVLTALENTDNGIIISNDYANRWNMTVGNLVQLNVGTLTSYKLVLFQIVGTMTSAPGFGVASTQDLAGTPFGAYFEFQPGLGGFALVNLGYLSNETGEMTARTFLIGASSVDAVSGLTNYLEALPYTEVYTTNSIDFSPQSVTGLFVAGLEGLTMICFIMCAAMGIASITLFLGAAVGEREPEYALFRAVGGTRRQIVSMVFGEFAGSVMAAVLISFVLGNLFGYTQTLLTFGVSSVWPILPVVLAYPLVVMLLTIAIECIVMVIVCYYPAYRAGNTDPAEVLRNM